MDCSKIMKQVTLVKFPDEISFEVQQKFLDHLKSFEWIFFAVKKINVYLQKIELRDFVGKVLMTFLTLFEDDTFLQSFRRKLTLNNFIVDSCRIEYVCIKEFEDGSEFAKLRIMTDPNCYFFTIDSPSNKIKKTVNVINNFYRIIRKFMYPEFCDIDLKTEIQIKELYRQVVDLDEVNRLRMNVLIEYFTLI